MTRSGKLMVACLAAILAAGWPVMAEAKSKRSVVATIDGKKVRWAGRLLSFTQNPSGFILVGTKIRAARTIGIGCPILLSARTYPVTFDTECSGQYARHAGKQYWFNTGLTGTPFSVTFDAFDGTVVTGHFSGTLPPVIGATAPVTVSGTFRGPLN